MPSKTRRKANRPPLPMVAKIECNRISQKPMSGVIAEEEEWRELGGIRVPKTEWVKTLKEQVEVRFYSIGASVG